MRINEDYVELLNDEEIISNNGNEVIIDDRNMPYLFLFEGTECNKSKKVTDEYVNRLIRFRELACKHLQSIPLVNDFSEHFKVYVGKVTDYIGYDMDVETCDYNVTDNLTVLTYITSPKNNGTYDTFTEYLADKNPTRMTFGIGIDADVSSLNKISKLMTAMLQVFTRCFNICFKDFGSYVSCLKYYGSSQFAKISSGNIDIWNERPMAEVNMFANAYMAFNPECSANDAKQIATEFCSPKNDEQKIKNILSYFKKNRNHLIYHAQEYLKSTIELVDDTLIIKPQQQYYIYNGTPFFYMIYRDWIDFIYKSYKKNQFKIKFVGLDNVRIDLRNDNWEFDFQKSEETFKKTNWFIKNILSDTTRVYFDVSGCVCGQYMDGTLNLLEKFPDAYEVHVCNNYETEINTFWEERFVDVPVIKKAFKVTFVLTDGVKTLKFKPN